MNIIDLWYELYLKDGKEEIGENIKGFFEVENILKLVVMLWCGDVWCFKISLLIKGIFKFCCYGGFYKLIFFRIVEFCIDNYVLKKYFYIFLFNFGCVGFGLGFVVIEVNLFILLYFDGLVFI